MTFPEPAVILFSFTGTSYRKYRQETGAQHMSKTLERLRRPGTSFYLRRPDGSFQGPLDLPELIGLAIHNRIPPGSEVSDDGAAWDPAESLPDLKLDWVASRPDGSTYGRFNLLALPHLIENGTIPETAELRNAISGRTVRARDVLKGDKTRKSDSAQGELALRPVIPAPPETQPGPAPEPKSAAAPEPPKVELKTEFRKLAEAEPAAARPAAASEDQDKRIGDLRKAVENSAERFREMVKKLQEEQTAHSRTVAENAKKEGLFNHRIAALEEQVRSMQVTLAQVRTDAERQRKWDQSLIDESRKVQAEMTDRVAQLRKAVEEANARAKDSLARLEHEQSTRTAAAEEARKAEIRLNEKIMKMEEESRSGSDVLARARMESEKQRQRDQSLLELSRQKENELTQRLDEAQRALDAKSADLMKLKTDLDRERLAHDETRKTAGEKERGVSTRLNDSEERARTLAASLKQAEQVSNERKDKLETLQREARNREQELLSRINELEKAVENSTRRSRELMQKIEEEESSFSEVSRNVLKKEQELNDKIGKLKEESGATSALLAQARQQVDDLRKQQSALQDQAKSRETRLSQKVEELQGELSRTVAQLEMARKKIDDKSAKTAPGPEQKEPDREKHLAALSAKLEKQVADQSRQLDQARADAARIQQETARAQKQAADRETALNEQVSGLKKTVEDLNRRIAAAAVSNMDSKRLEADVSAAGQREAELASRNRQLAEEIRGLNDALAAARREAETALRNKKDLKASLDSLTAQHQRMVSDAAGRAGHDTAGIRESAAQQPKPAGMSKSAMIIAAALALACFALGMWLRGMMPGSGKVPGKSPVPAAKQAEPPAPALSAAQSKPGHAPPATVAPQPSTDSATTTPPPAANTVSLPAPAPPPKPKIRWPAISVDSVFVSQADDYMNIVFSYGTFTYLAILQGRAKNDLSSIAQQLSGSMDDFSLVVEGVTDSVPLGSNTVYASNQELGLARAQVVAEYLVTDCGLPARAVKAVSSGDARAPFPNNDLESRKKNRTVVLRLVPNQR